MTHVNPGRCLGLPLRSKGAAERPSEFEKHLFPGGRLLSGPGDWDQTDNGAGLIAIAEGSPTEDFHISAVRPPRRSENQSLPIRWKFSGNVINLLAAVPGLMLDPPNAARFIQPSILSK